MFNQADREQAIAALEAFLDAVRSDRREDAVIDLRTSLSAEMRTGLARQSAELQRRMVGLRPMFVNPDAQAVAMETLTYFSAAADLTYDQMEAGLFDNIWHALVRGGGHLVDDIGVPLSISFNLDNPRSVSWAIRHAAEQVTRINETTRDAIRRVIVSAVETGQSYNKTADALAQMFEFSPGRAHRIAVYETGSAYERGKLMAADELVAQGLELEKRWISAGDSRVRPAHVANHLAMWIPKDERFPGDGADLPPTDPGCRCSVAWRVAPDK